MSNSPLINYTWISPNRNSPRNHSIDRITIHCVVGQASVEGLGELFANPGREASSNYGIGSDGRIGMYCPESDRSWCSSSPENDHRAITIECASDTYHPYAVNSAVYHSLILLCTDICARNGKDKLLWLGDKWTALNYIPKSNEMIMTAHRWFADTICPGDYLYSRFGQIAKEVTERLEAMKWVKCWRLYDDKGILQTGWKKVNNNWYYLNKNDGIMMTGWFYDTFYNGWFLLAGSGEMLTGWQEVKGKWYYLATTTTGGDIKGKMKTGWLKNKNKWYYLDKKDGYMYTGTHIIDGKTYYFNNDGSLIE